MFQTPNQKILLNPYVLPWFVGSIAILPWSTQGALRVQRRQHRAAHRQLPEDGRGRLNGAASAKFSEEN
jgi:hypothetical protein